MSTTAVYRIGRRPNPWQYPDWSRANRDRTFGNRFDDPNGEYRVLYASSLPVGLSGVSFHLLGLIGVDICEASDARGVVLARPSLDG